MKSSEKFIHLIAVMIIVLLGEVALLLSLINSESFVGIRLVAVAAISVPILLFTYVLGKLRINKKDIDNVKRDIKRYLNNLNYEKKIYITIIPIYITFYHILLFGEAFKVSQFGTRGKQHINGFEDYGESFGYILLHNVGVPILFVLGYKIFRWINKTSSKIKNTNKNETEIVKEIEILSKLHKDGMLNDEQFEKAKSKLLE